ncbi:hypothetical protein BaRGS_00038481 [Batillaria attramentaria]|uniref:Uncharacterized protein n=1 Tax=Batillaria attramentaria TaxID=370345 RepID=A0ABD0J653_9CAEN
MKDELSLFMRIVQTRYKSVTMAISNDKLTMQALKQHDKIHPRFQATTGSGAGVKDGAKVSHHRNFGCELFHTNTAVRISIQSVGWHALNITCCLKDMTSHQSTTKAILVGRTTSIVCCLGFKLDSVRQTRGL